MVALHRLVKLLFATLGAFVDKLMELLRVVMVDRVTELMDYNKVDKLSR